MSDFDQNGGSQSVSTSRGTEHAVGKYVYCVVAASDPREFGEIGIGTGARVHTVHLDSLAAVVSDSPLRVYDPTRENVLAHEYVNEVVMRDFTLIPMSFGTIFRTEEDIVELLRSAYDTFVDALDKIADKIEFGLKVLWDRERVLAQLEQDDPELGRQRRELAENPQAATYFARMELGQRIEDALEAAAERYSRDIHEALKPATVAARVNKPIGERMIVNAAFLVERSAETAFDARVKEISRKYEGLLTFRYTGPWPPYNFVNIKLKLEKAG
jgi:hypothetical protein